MYKIKCKCGTEYESPILATMDECPVCIELKKAIKDLGL
jgi:hypothetical protein